jgi:hypothetical protein
MPVTVEHEGGGAAGDTGADDEDLERGTTGNAVMLPTIWLAVQAEWWVTRLRVSAHHAIRRSIIRAPSRTTAAT